MKKRGRKTLFQLSLVLGFLIVVGVSFGLNVLAPQKQLRVPDQLGTLKLVSSIEGADALAQINRLHGIQIEVVSAYIAEYRLDNERVTVWVGTAENSGLAANLLSRMVEGISRGNPSFSNLKRLSIPQGYHSHEVFQVEGAGGKHFFYNSREVKERVVWLTVEATDPLTILGEALKIF